MERKYEGYAHCIDGVLDVDWELSTIEDAQFLRDAVASGLSYEKQMIHLAENCLVKVDPDFPHKVNQGDFLIGNRGLGWGHGHDHAVLALKAVGIAVIICETTTVSFKRNCINHGIPLIEIKGIFSEAHTGDLMELELDQGNLRNISAGTTHKFSIYPEFLLEIIDMGGIYIKLQRDLDLDR